MQEGGREEEAKIVAFHYQCSQLVCVCVCVCVRACVRACVRLYCDVCYIRCQGRCKVGGVYSYFY